MSTTTTAAATTGRWDLAYGAFLGALCGDAAGAVLEFFREEITEEVVASALQMPGGGAHRVGRGQITDDSELALSLARGLADHDPALGFPSEAVAVKYTEWRKSKPFDIGATCSLAFRVAPDADGNYADTMTSAAANGSMGSEANGALMRVLPVALWSHLRTPETIAALARREATLSHPNQVCQDCSAVYCMLIAYLIHHPGDNTGAIAHVEPFVRAKAHPKVRGWFFEESLDLESLVCSKLAGHVRWAFTLSIHFLRQNTGYEAAIRLTLLKGGDTDTNAAIVGGLMGALHGDGAIPDHMKGPVLAFDCSVSTPARRRPVEFKSDQIIELTQQLTGIARP